MSRVAPNIDCGVEGVVWSTHARKRWAERSRCPGRDLDRAWHEAVPVDYPSARGDSAAWYHPDAGVVLLATPDDGELVVTTAIQLTDRPTEEQAYVRAQVRYR